MPPASQQCASRCENVVACFEFLLHACASHSIARALAHLPSPQAAGDVTVQQSIFGIAGAAVGFVVTPAVGGWSDAHGRRGSIIAALSLSTLSALWFGVFASGSVSGHVYLIPGPLLGMISVYALALA